MQGIESWLELAAGGGWIYPALLLLVIADAFVVVLPSETVVVALGSLALSTGSPNFWLLLVAAALGAVVGDNLSFAIGRRIGTDRFAWMRRPRIRAAFGYAGRSLLQRPASLILTARYVPFARIAVNLTAGASRFPYRRYLPLTIVAGLSWALYNSVIGAIFGAWLTGNPLAAVAVSVVVAIALGVALDAVSSRISRARGRDSAATGQ